MGEYFKQTSRALSKYQDVYVLTNNNVTSEDCGTNNIYNVGFDRQSLFSFFSPKSYIKIYNYLHRVKYDVVMMCSPHPVNFFVYMCVPQHKMCTYVHDHIMHSGVSKINAFWMNMLLNVCYKRSSKIALCCKRMKEDVVRLGKKKAEDVNVIYMPAIETLCFNDVQIKESIDVLFFGRIEKYKGLDMLIRVAQINPSINFQIAGKGDLNKVFGIKELPSNVIHHNRFVPDQELAQMISSSKIVVFPYRDATGTQTVQSVSFYKKPIVATNVGCFSEYVVNNQSGFIVEFNDVTSFSDSIRKLMGDEELRHRFGNFGHNRITTEFNNDVIANRYIEMFRSM